MIEVKNLTKYYNQVPAIRDLNFKLQKGEIVGLLGLNGSGKTTTLRILTGFLIPSEGEVMIENISHFTNPIEAKRMIGYLPETPPLYEDLQIEDYLKYVARLKGVPEMKLESEVIRVLEKTNLLEKRSTLIGHISLGYRKRTGIAQALLGNPPIVVMDEPISGLDPKQILDMRNLIKGLRGEHTVFISSHILSELHKTCDRFLFLHQGELKFDLTREELDSELGRFALLEINLEGKSKEELVRYLKSLDSSLEIISAEDDRMGCTFTLKSISDKILIDKILESLKKEGITLNTLKRQEVTLEQMFLTKM
jgi:ABC-2 type transport system ATP-binding protein